MNAFLAGLFVTSAWISLAYLALKHRGEWNTSKLGLVLYAIGTFMWSLKGIELGDTGLITISAIQTFAVLIGIILL